MGLVSKNHPDHQPPNGNPKAWDLVRWGAMLGGGALALLGLTRRTKPGFALAAAGGLLAYRAATLDSEQRQLHAESSFAVAAPPEELYAFWRNFENLPQFMRNLEQVRVVDDKHSEWRVSGRFDTRIRWAAEIVEEKANEWIVWQSLPGSEIDCRGSVYFRPAVGGRGTIVTAAVQYRPPAGTVAKSVATLLGKDPGFMLREDLRRFKALTEAGEVPNVEGQSHGSRSALHKAGDIVYPEKRKPSEFATDRKQLQAQRSVS